jgi:hypothetical protein
MKPLHIIFPKPVRTLRANSEYIASSLGEEAAITAVPNAMRLKGWSDVMVIGAVSIGGGCYADGRGRRRCVHAQAVKQLMRTAKGRTTRRRRPRSYRRSLGDADELLDFGDIDDLGEEVIET